MNKTVMLMRMISSPRTIAIIRMISSSSAFLIDEFFPCIVLYIIHKKIHEIYVDKETSKYYIHRWKSQSSNLTGRC